MMGVVNLKVLVIGGGAREHVICETVKKFDNVELYSIMSNINPGIKSLSEEYLFEKETEIDKIVKYSFNYFPRDVSSYSIIFIIIFSN